MDDMQTPLTFSPEQQAAGWITVGHKGGKERTIDLVNEARSPLYDYLRQGEQRDASYSNHDPLHPGKSRACKREAQVAPRVVPHPVGGIRRSEQFSTHPRQA